MMADLIAMLGLMLLPLFLLLDLADVMPIDNGMSIYYDWFNG